MFPSRIEIQKLTTSCNPENRLDLYYEAYKNLPKQGSDEWARDRKIGGSSVAPILGIEKFSTKKKVAEGLIASSFDSSFAPRAKEGGAKEGKETQNKNEIAMNWGTVFEEAAKIYLSRFIKIYEFGSLPGFEINGQTVTSYSPDGIFKMTEELADELALDSSFAQRAKEGRTKEEVFPSPSSFLQGKNEEKNGEVLLEIKCPFMRKITGEVPEYYLPQMQLGMHTIGFVDQALYCEFSFRICSLSDLNFSSSCSSFTNNGIYDTPKAIGFLGFVYEEDFKTTKIPSSLLSFHDNRENETQNVSKESVQEIGAELRKLESIYKNISEIEKYAFLQKYCNNDVLSEIFRINYPHFEGIDFGGSMNFLYKTTDLSDEDLMAFAKKKIREGDYFASEQLYDSEIDLWSCREFFSKQLNLFLLHSRSSSKFDEEKMNIGIVCYKLFQVEANLIEKKPFDNEIETILKFAAQVEEIKKKPPQEQKSCLESL